MMGQKFVSIDPGTPSLGALDIEKPIEGEYEASIAEMMSGAGRTVAVMESLAVKISNFIVEMDSSGGGAAIGRTFTNVEAATGDIAELTKSTKTDLRRAISNFDAGTREFKDLMSDKGPTLRTTIDNFAATSARLDSIGAELAVLSRQARELLAQAHSTDGNVGALLEDRELYDRLLGTVARTDSLLRDIQRNPRRYFKFSVF
jgi:phospholipid/cholesterol/gamma-HCH transport system substrate-binding protein